VLAIVTLGFVVLNLSTSLWLHRLSANKSSLPLSVSTVAFAALWLLLRGAPRTPRFVRIIGRWTNARAAQWWAAHRHELRSGGAEPSVRTATGDVRSPHLTVTRVAG